MKLKAPFPWFGGKSRVSDIVWGAFGDVKNYVEPFFGSGAVLLARTPSPDGGWGTETVNDLDGYVANFWRAVAHDPDAVANYADWPVNENDLHARHVWLIQQAETLKARLEGDMDFHDPKIAGMWVWGICNWIGGGFCAPDNGPWWPDENGLLVKRDRCDAGMGVSRRRPHLTRYGVGVSRSSMAGGLVSWMQALSDRIRRVRVCSGDWARITGPSVTDGSHGLTGVFLDPPYANTAGRYANIYKEDSLSVAHDVREWAIANGDRPTMRIALCGYEGEHEMPKEWECVEWNASGGYGKQAKDGKENAHRERIWFSPACLGAKQASIYDA